MDEQESCRSGADILADAIYFAEKYDTLLAKNAAQSARITELEAELTDYRENPSIWLQAAHKATLDALPDKITDKDGES